MKRTIHTLLLCCLAQLPVLAQKPGSYNTIWSGVPWFDKQGSIISAHAAGITREKGVYYLFGEKHTDGSNAFAGVNCYSSTDLCNWKAEGVALQVQRSGKLGPNRVGERPKVMKCPATGEYVMYIHADSGNYKDQYVGYATATKITGPYTFKGPLLLNGSPVRKWDMGTFQDADGAGYVLVHGGGIYRLAADYKSIVSEVNAPMAKGFEAPTLFRKDSLYYFLGSDLTGWERNDNYYYTAAALSGPWTLRGHFCPEGTLTWNSQSTFVLPVYGSQDTTFLFMGDRWSYPNQASAATYVWQPLKVSGTSLSVPQYRNGWQLNTATGVILPSFPGTAMLENTDKKGIAYYGSWKHTNDSVTISSADHAGDSCTITFTGSQVALYGYLRPDGGYARAVVRNAKGKVVLSCLLDMYCQYAVSSLSLITPQLPRDTYTLTLTVMGTHWYWVNKKGDSSGSKGNYVSIDRVSVTDPVFTAQHHNPVIKGLYADPDIIYSEKTHLFYIYPTSDGFTNWAGSYFKAFSSPDLVNWKDEGVILDLPRQVKWAKVRAWAPCIMERKINGKYQYFYYFCAEQKIGVAVSDNPAGPFVDKGSPLIDKRPDFFKRKGGQSIDPDVFQDPQTGKYYLYWGNGYMAGAELNDDMVSLKTETIHELTPDSTFTEGTHVFYRNGKYYFLWSQHDTRDPNYRVRYGIADSPLGKITMPEQSTVVVRDDAEGIFGTGHNSTIQVPGKDEWYLVYHRFQYPNGIYLGREAGYNREVCIDSMQFNADGTIQPVKPAHTGIKPVTVK